MKSISKLLPVLFIFFTAYAPHAFADDAVVTMAKIVSSLQHFPSEADKQALAAIVASDASKSEKTVAAAVAGISHQVSGTDKSALKVIAANDAEAASLRALATIIVGINHMPNAEAKIALAALTGE